MSANSSIGCGARGHAHASSGSRWGGWGGNSRVFAWGSATGRRASWLSGSTGAPGADVVEQLRHVAAA